MAPGLFYRLSGSLIRVSKEVGTQDYSEKHTTPEWRPYKCQVGVIYGREKVRLHRTKDSSWA